MQNTESYNVNGVRLARPFKIRRLGHAGFVVSDVDRMVDFYSRVLGFRTSDSFDITQVPGLPDHFRTLADPRLTFLNVGSDHHSLVLVHHSVNQALGEAKPEVTVHQISWQVNSLSEVVDGSGYLAQRGLKLSRVGRDSPGSNWHVYFNAPDRHLNELFYGIEQIGWNRKSKPRPMPVALWGEIKLPQRPESGEIREALANGIDIDTGHQAPSGASPSFTVGGVLLDRPFKVVRIGPLRLFVDDVRELETFYRDTLGLELTEEVMFEGERIVFLRAGSEHHSIALYPIALREKLGFNPNSRAMSLGLQVGSYAQLRDARHYLLDQGFKLIDLPPQLYPGIDYAVNVVDPEGNCLQLYYYMEQIGWDGKARSADQRRPVDPDWPEAIEPQSDTFLDIPFPGPID